MATFANANFTKRNYDCTNVVAAVAEQAPSFGFSGHPADYWVEADDSILNGLTKLGSVAGVTFYGYM